LLGSLVLRVPRGAKDQALPVLMLENWTLITGDVVYMKRRLLKVNPVQSHSRKIRTNEMELGWNPGFSF
jgi:hypothetical protein